jgi:co-chaperonin GroES (HSP10)
MTMTSSNYLDQFKAMASESADAYELYGDCLLVEKLKEPERKIGSIILATASGRVDSFAQDRPHFVKVLAIGKGFYNEETGQDVPLSVAPGDIILVGPMSVKYFSMFGSLEAYEPDSIGITRESEIQLRFKGEEGYGQVFATLNKYAKKKVAEGGS